MSTTRSGTVCWVGTSPTTARVIFDHFGFSLITIRNGNRAMADQYPKVYAEKLLYLKEGQYAPNHFHWYKTEDIINRGGGNGAHPGV